MTVTINGFNVGTDASATLSDNFGNVLPLEQLGLLTEFESQSLDRELEVVPISNGGVPVFMTIWAGVRGKVMFTRTDGTLESLITSLMAAYYEQHIIPVFSMQLDVINRDGSIDEYLLSGMQIGKPTFGNYRAEKEVDQGFEFRAGLMSTTGGAPALFTFAA